MLERAELLSLTLIVVGILLLLVLRLAREPDGKFPYRLRQRVSIAGVVIGGITPILPSIIFVILLLIYVQIAPPPKGLFAMAPNGWLHWLLQSTLGLGLYALGGYVAARIAGHDELLNGLLSSFLWIAPGLGFILAKGSHASFAQIFSLAAIPASALLGGYLRQRQKRISRTPGLVGPFA